MNTLDVEAEAKKLPQVLRFIDESLEAMGFDHRLQTQIDVAAEEIFVNISSYAYQPEKGQARIQVEKKVILPPPPSFFPTAERHITPWKSRTPI